MNLVTFESLFTCDMLCTFGFLQKGTLKDHSKRSTDTDLRSTDSSKQSHSHDSYIHLTSTLTSQRD